MTATTRLAPVTAKTPDRNEALNEQNEDADTTADEKDPCPAGEQDAAAPSGDTSVDCDTPRTATTESSTTRTTRRPTGPSQERPIQAAKPRLGCDDECQARMVAPRGLVRALGQPVY